MSEIVCLGISVVDLITEGIKKIPEPGKLELVDSIRMFTGGCAVNAAIDLAKIGEDVGIISLIGNDGMGKFLKDALDASGVDTTGISTTDSIGTSASVVLINEHGERSFLHTTGANAVFSEDYIPWEVLNNTKYLVVAGSLLMPTFDGIQTSYTLKKAQDKGIFTVLDTAWDSTGQWANLIDPCLPFIDLFIPSYEEAVELSGFADVNLIATHFLTKGVKTVVIKLGAEGCYVKNHVTSFSCPTNPVPVSDTTGAGDSFVAGFVAGLNNGWSLEACAEFANAIGAHCVQTIGASTGIPTKEETLNYIKMNKEN